jgi:hypothetical protein
VKEGIMNRKWKTAIWAVTLSVVWVLAGSAQAVFSLPQRGDQVTVEGELTYVQAKGSAILELKTEAGREYRVQIPFGMITELRQKGFDPKVGEKIRVAGEVVCVMAETPVIAASEIRFNGKTYRMAPEPS